MHARIQLGHSGHGGKAVPRFRCFIVLARVNIVLQPAFDSPTGCPWASYSRPLGLRAFRFGDPARTRRLVYSQSSKIEHVTRAKEQ